MSKFIEVVLVEMTPSDRGEAIDFSAEIRDQGDGNVYTDCSITLHSPGPSASINMGTIDPQVFRDIADKLDEAIARNTRTNGVKISFPRPAVGTGKSGEMT